METTVAGFAARKSEVNASSDAEPAPQKIPLQTIALKNRSVIRTATIELRVKQVEETEKKLNAAILELGGFVDNVVSTDLAGSNASISATARIPVERFDEAIALFESMGVRLSKTISGQDVTAQLIDIDARVKTKLIEEEILRNMLRKTVDNGEIIQIRSRLTELRAELESIAAQRKNLAESAALSTITVTLRQSSAPASVGTDPNWLAEAYGEASSSATGLLRTVVTALVWLALFSPAWGLALLLILGVNKRIRASAREAHGSAAKV